MSLATEPRVVATGFYTQLAMIAVLPDLECWIRSLLARGSVLEQFLLQAVTIVESFRLSFDIASEPL